ncbi:MAG: hypothetical protein RBT63_06890 [Bdellovibrionales bacterium]|jgi:flagellar motility protein MotE (MotC chaperone)|nr:hypothetical protein [Bdellovibrionales bacterium]
MGSNDKASGYKKFFADAKKSAERNLTPEQMVLRHLAEQENQKRREKRKAKRPKPPYFAMVMLVCAIISGVVGLSFPEALDYLKLVNLPKMTVGLFGFAKAQDGQKAANSASSPAANVAASNQNPAKASSDETLGEKAQGEHDLRSWTSEELSFFKGLNDRKQELDRREAELVKLEEELQKQKAGIEEKIQELDGMRKEISTTLQGRVEQDQEKVAKLIEVYANMKPAQASRVIETLNEDLAVSILDGMKKKNAAEILNMMSAAKARKLSEMLTGYRHPASTPEKTE